MDKPEIRSYDFEMRAEEADGKKKLVGYAAIFDSLSEPLGGFREIIRQGAFSRTVDNAEAEVMALNHHDWSQVLARRSNGTLTLATDDKGLRVEIELNSTTRANDLYEDVKTGNIRSMSFGFFVHKDAWSAIEEEGERDYWIRELLDVELEEVSPITMPAYADTSIAVRELRALQISANPPATSVEVLRLRQEARKLTTQER